VTIRTSRSDTNRSALVPKFFALSVFIGGLLAAILIPSVPSKIGTGGSAAAEVATVADNRLPLRLFLVMAGVLFALAILKAARRVGSRKPPSH
jgi:hypothetical protein